MPFPLSTPFQASAQRQKTPDDSRPAMADLCALFKDWKNEFEALSVRTPHYLEDWAHKRVYLTAKISAPISQPMRTLHLSAWEHGEASGPALHIVARVDGKPEKDAFLAWSERETKLTEFAMEWLRDHGGDYVRDKLLAGPQAP